ncbi:MAG: class I SAM-dependent methyltransferase [Chitinispirillales bacterium]|jgi:hypothetical protein|nr:class I SAM-dependent methyltransferase [Chitinispirillales bacterium]
MRLKQKIKKTLLWRALRKTGVIKLAKYIQTLKRKRQTLGLIGTLKPLEPQNSPLYVVSLTSYGKRLACTAPYAIITLLNQSIKPDKIVLWVADEDKEKIPKLMKRLVEKGLEIRFCEDIKSYKKLIPALKTFPDSHIITADDDVYYPQDWFEQLITEHRKNPKKIICHRAHGIKVDENHNTLQYLQWDFGKHIQCCFESIFPTGVGGILYPPNVFIKDITDVDLFMKLAPKADDIWFWAMAVINKEYFGDKSPYIVIENGYSKYLQDVEPEQQQDGNALWNYNCAEGGNDKQLKAVIEHYPQLNDVLRKITPGGFDSVQYWEHRYAKSGNSGAGSYGRLAEFKAKVLNKFVKENDIKNIIEFGHGDGNQLLLAEYPQYLGFDVSQIAVDICKGKFVNDVNHKEFRLMGTYNGDKAELTLSLDVIYHLIEDKVFENYMKTLFEASEKYVVIYASNKTGEQWTEHVKHRKFTDWIDENTDDWKLLQFIPNKYPAVDNGNNPNTSFADFYVFGKR